MRILFNALTAVGAKSGIGHYAHEMIRCLRARLGTDAVASFPGPVLSWACRSAKQLNGWLGKKAATSTPTSGSGLKDKLRQAGFRFLDGRFRAAARFGGFDLYHEPNHVPIACDLPTIVTLMDLSVLLHPEWHPAHRVARFEQDFRRGLAQGAHFLTISDFTRREVLTHLGLPPERVTRTYLGIGSEMRPLPESEVRPLLNGLGLEPGYLLHLGTLEPRKNLLLLLRAYCGLPEALRRRHPLVLVGGWGWNFAELVEYYEAEARQRGVRHLGYVSDAQRVALYNGARALVFPSHYEGFGLPPVEMLACGGAVLASAIPPHAEIVGPKAHLIDPRDQDAWRTALHRVLTDDDWHRQLREGSESFARGYTWERCAAETLAVYERVLGLRQRRAA